jgi:SAM-dependent methyltransferase
MDASGDSDATYIIRSGAAAESRLELLARICWPATEQFLHRRGALRGRVLDVGCGSGDVAVRMIAALMDCARASGTVSTLLRFVQVTGRWRLSRGNANRPNIFGAFR